MDSPSTAQPFPAFTLAETCLPFPAARRSQVMNQAGSIVILFLQKKAGSVAMSEQHVFDARPAAVSIFIVKLGPVKPQAFTDASCFGHSGDSLVTVAANAATEALE